MSVQPDLAFPTIAQPEAGAVATRPTTIAEAALALFSPHEATMLALAAKYRDVAFDLSTPKGLKAAKDARLELREQGRFAIQRLRDKTKDQLNDCKKVVESEATRLIALVEPVENAVHQQITAHEEKLAAEKAERDRIEAERKQKHLDAIAVIASYVDKAQGLPVERVEAGIAYVQAIDVSAEVFEEFAARAAEQKQVTIERLQKMVAELKAEAEAERLRLENERIAAELAAQKRALEEQAAEIERQRKEFEAAQASAAALPAANAGTEAESESPAREGGQPCATREAAPIQWSEMAVSTSAGQHSQESACSTQAGGQDDAPTAAERRGDHAEDSEDLPGVAPGPLHHDTPQQDSQQVLKAEAATPDATDREPPAIGSPDGGPMGAGQPAAAGPVGDIALLAQCLELTEYAAAAFAGRFPSHPKPGPDWWAGLRDRIERLQPLLQQATNDH